MNYEKILHKIKNGEISAEEGAMLIKALNKTSFNDIYFYRNCWKKSVIENIAVTDDSKPCFKKLLLFDSNNNLYNKLLETASPETVTLVTPGKEFKQISPEQYNINTHQKTEYKKILSAAGHIDQVIYNWSPAPGENLNSEEVYNTLFNLSLISLLYLIQSLGELQTEGIKEELSQILLLYRLPENEPFPPGELFTALPRSLKLVMPRITFSTLGFQSGFVDQDDICPILEKELLIQSRGYTFNNILFGKKEEGYGRYYQHIVPVPAPRKEKSLLKEKGVYLITGGLGKLGMLFARHLLNHYKARVILTGRSPLTPEKEKNLNELKGLKGEIIYLEKTNAADISAMTRAVGFIKEKFGILNGIIHAAGTVDEINIFNKKYDDFKAILLPKITGTRIVDSCSQKENLDFFLIFSSTSSVLGDFGQCDYSLGNRFADIYAAYREKKRIQDTQRRGRTLLAVWPLWRNGGMHINKEGELLYMNSSGLEYLEDDEGINIFEHLLAAEEKIKELIIMKGNKARIEDMLQINMKEEFPNIKIEDLKTSVQQNREASANSPGDENLYLRKIKKDITAFISRILKLPEERIEEDENFGTFGLDSISFKQLSNHIDKSYNITLSPAVFFTHTTIALLCCHLLEVFPKQISRSFNTYKKRPEKLKPNPSLLRQKHSFKEKQSLSPSNQPTAPLPDHQYVMEQTKEVAIIGVSAFLPQSSSLDEFWQFLKNQDDLITLVPGDRWDWRQWDGDPRTEKNKTNSKWLGAVNDVDKFDPAFFKILPSEAEVMDPQHRLFLLTAWNTFEDAGYKISNFSGKRIGVFVGAQFNDYEHMILKKGIFNKKLATGNSHAALANRVSYLFNFTGPSLSIDTACSSSLVAFHHAVKSIQRGESSLAIAGGVSLILSPETLLYAGQLGILSPDGRCKTFDKQANGYVKGEGVISLLLKPLKEAKQDKDHIYAVVKGSAVNHGGKAHSFTAPNSEAQSELIFTACKEGEITPETISYIEAHGTGTELGDPVEIEGLKLAFQKLNKYYKIKNPPLHYCGIGSVKTNIGHLEPAAGLAGIIKIILSMKYKTLPGLVHFKKQNPYIHLKDTPFYIADKTQKWVTPVDPNGRNFPRRAGVSSFGFGGTNAHVILEEYTFSEKNSNVDEEELIILSARTEKKLKDYVLKIIQFMEEKSSPCHSLQMKKQKIEEYSEILKQILGELLGIDSGEISDDDDFSELGVDHVTLMTFAGKVNRFFDLDLSLPVFTGSLRSLAELLKQECTVLSGGVEDEPGTPSSFSLKEMAYTLQTGREEMHKRLGVIVSSPRELKEKLKAFYAGEEEIPGLETGDLDRKKNKMERLFEGNLVKRITEEALNTRALKELALLWLSGVPLDWEKLYSVNKPGRISLPTYPFEKKRFWLEEKTTDLWLSGRSQIHPLLGENVSTVKELKFITYFNGKEFFLDDHIVNGKKTLPGAAYLEMARRGASTAGEKNVNRIVNVIWAKPLFLSGEEKKVTLILQQGKEYLDFTVLTTNSSGEESIHSRGKAEFSFMPSSGQETSIDIQAVIRRSQQNKSAEECYRLFYETGLQYGPAFQGIQELYYNETESLARIELPVQLKKEFEKFTLHPSLLDASFQSIAGLIYREMAEGNPYLPFSLGEVEIIHPLTMQCYAYAVNSNTQKENSPVKSFDIKITDPQGKILIKINRFSVRTIRTEVERKPASENRDNLFYFHKRWKKHHIEPGERLPERTTILLFDNREILFPVLKILTPENSRLILIRQGNSFKYSDPEHFFLNPEKEGDYHTLLETLKTEGAIPEYVIHNWTEHSGPFGGTHLNKHLVNGAYSLFYMTRAFSVKKLKIKLLYLYSEEDINPSYSAVLGMIKTIPRENPFLSYKAIALSEDSRQGAALIIASELADTSIALDISYKNKFRYVTEYFAGDIPTEKEPVKIRTDGVYIITGGTGGLGMIFAKYLADKYNARLVLTGRSILNEEKKEKINALKSQGHEVFYYQADVNSQNEVEKLINWTRDKWGMINGVIHSAGVIKDSFVVKKTIEDFKRVLEPKVYGTLYLDTALKDEEKLDFFMLFSSITAVIGNPGQIDYAFANSFLDDFTVLREKQRLNGKHRGKSISINWPLWKEGGMSVDVKSEEYFVNKLGLYPLKTEEGIRAFEESLTSSSCRTILFSGVKEKIMNLLEERKKPSENSGKKTEINPGTVEKELIEICSVLFKVNANDIETEVELSDYGVDSIMMMDIMNAIEIHYGDTIDPNAIVEHSTIQKLALHLIDRGIAGKQHQEDTKEIHPAETAAESFPPGDKFILHKIPEKEPIRENAFFPDHQTVIKPLFSSEKIKSNKIAVIGMACRFPGSPDPESFWENMKEGKDLISLVPEERWKITDYYSPEENAPGKSYSKWAGLLEDIYSFDAGFFGISPEDAIVMDPQHRLLLELAQELFDRSGYTKQEIDASRTSIYIGAAESRYVKNNYEIIPGKSMKNLIVNSIQNMMAARISDYYNLKGKALVIDTACSSSAVALHQACGELISGESDMAVVGGIYLILDAYHHIGFSKSGALSKTKWSYVFDERAKGFVLGEGAGLVLLKPYEKALADGDMIEGVILGSAVNNDGHTMGLTTPGMDGQKQVIRQALEKSAVNPRTINYLEAHGTGTLLGDPIEIKAATQVYREFTEEKQYCAVGSVKSNIGHTLTAAGIAGLIKILLGLKNRLIPPTLHCENPHKRFGFGESPFYPIVEAQPWEPSTGVRRAALSSFGFGGTNAHIILEEGPPEHRNTRNPLPRTIFNREKYKLEATTTTLEVKKEKKHYTLEELLTRLSLGELSPEEAMQYRRAGRRKK